jgi:hypothetical protein
MHMGKRAFADLADAARRAHRVDDIGLGHANLLMDISYLTRRAASEPQTPGARIRGLGSLRGASMALDAIISRQTIHFCHGSIG